MDDHLDNYNVKIILKKGEGITMIPMWYNKINMIYSIDISDTCILKWCGMIIQTEEIWGEYGIMNKTVNLVKVLPNSWTRDYYFPNRVRLIHNRFCYNMSLDYGVKYYSRNKPNQQTKVINKLKARVYVLDSTKKRI